MLRSQSELRMARPCLPPSPRLRRDKSPHASSGYGSA